MRFQRRVAQLGSATGLGPVGRRFESSLADQFCEKTVDLSSFYLALLCLNLSELKFVQLSKKTGLIK